MALPHIVISGDAPRQLFLSPKTILGSFSDAHKRQVQWIHGGAGLISQLLRSDPDAHEKMHIHEPNFKTTDSDTSIRSVVELAWNKRTDADSFALKLKSIQTLDAAPCWHAPDLTVLSGNDNAPWLWVLQDADSGSSFSEGDSKLATSMIRHVKPQYIIYHMSRPLCQGDLWKALQDKPVRGNENQTNKQQLIVIVHADDLRAAGVELSYGLSWERICEDFVQRLGSVGTMSTLVNCAHLLVLFGCDGVIYHRGSGPSRAKPVLLFDPLCVEGVFEREHLGPLPGTAETFAAGFVRGLVTSGSFIGGGAVKNPEEGIQFGIQSGLLAAQRLSTYGLRPEGLTYPASAIMQNLVGPKKEGDKSREFLRTLIPADKIVRGDNANWSLIDDLVGDPVEVGRRIVQHGVLSIIRYVPTAHIGRLFAFDRQEIESLRTLFNCVCEYLTAPEQQTRPLNIALCGPSSSGKAFAALEVATAAVRASERKEHELRVDLSQLTDSADLQDALHSVRDCTLEGKTPLVYFSGLDSLLSDKPWGWLPHLLPPMLSGKFLDQHGVNRPIGPVIFLFDSVSDSAETLRYQASRDRPAIRIESSSKRLRDFLNSLHGCVNIRGLNRFEATEDGIDKLYPVRRAVVLRSLLEQREPALLSNGNGELSIDESVLNSLLLTPHYSNGIRSLKAILTMSRLNGRRRFEWAALPPQSQLELHVDYEEFLSYRWGLPFPGTMREELARKLNGVYVEHMRSCGKNESEWKDLKEEFKQSTRDHVDSIPQKLRLVSCFSPPDSEEGHYANHEKVIAFTQDQIETLAEAEHDRWNAERLRKNWRLSDKRSLDSHESPYLVPWADLEENVKDIDRIMVKSYPELVSIYKMRQWK